MTRGLLFIICLLLDNAKVISGVPSVKPSARPSVSPTTVPTAMTSVTPSVLPSPKPISLPTTTPTTRPTRCPSFAPTAVPTHVPGTAIFEYNFMRNDCLSRSISDMADGSILGSLILDPLLRCPMSNGVENYLTQPLIQSRSSSSIQRLAIETGKPALSIALWLEIGNGSIEVDTTLLSVSSGTGMNLELRQRAYSTSLYMTASSSGITTDLTGLNDGVLAVHEVAFIVFSVQYIVTQSENGILSNISVNGVGNQETIGGRGEFHIKSSSNIKPFAPGYWDTAAHLRLFSGSPKFSSNTPSWQGVIYKVALYNDILQPSEIDNIYNKKLPNSMPVVWNVTYTIKEGGEVGDHHNNPEYYRKEVPFIDLAVLILPIYDFDDDPKSPNYAENARENCKKLEIVSIPKRGTLYDLLNNSRVSNGYMISCTSNYSLKYRPQFKQFSKPPGSVFDQFLIRGLDGETGAFSEKNATIFIVVDRVNTPPEPLTNNTYITVFENVPSHIYLQGSDSDGTIQASRLITLPRLGDIRSKYSNTSKIISSNQVLKSLDYVYTFTSVNDSDSEGEFQNTEFIATDSFQYVLYDNLFNFSIPSNVTILVKRSLVVKSSSLYAAQQIMDIQRISVLDHSQYGHRLCLTIDKSSMYGTLQDIETNLTVDSGFTIQKTLMPSEYSIGFPIKYISHAHFFSYPMSKFNGDPILGIVNDSMTVTTAACDSKQIASTSKEIHIIVQNVNDPTNITYHPLKSPLTVYPSGSTSSNSNPSQIMLQRIQIFDPDLDVDIIRVKIDTINGGLITLMTSIIPKLDFISFTYCYGQIAWQCTGDGYDDSSMSFVGLPSDIEIALNGMQYQNPYPDVTDYVEIILYDGEGGECLSKTQLGSGSIRNGCFTTRLNITVKVLDYSPVSFMSNLSSSGNWLSLQNIAIAGGVILFILLFCWRCCFRQCCASKKDYESGSDSDYDTSSSDSESSHSIDKYSNAKHGGKKRTRKCNSKKKKLANRRNSNRQSLVDLECGRQEAAKNELSNRFQYYHRVSIQRSRSLLQRESVEKESDSTASFFKELEKLSEIHKEQPTVPEISSLGSKIKKHLNSEFPSTHNGLTENLEQTTNSEFKSAVEELVNASQKIFPVPLRTSHENKHPLRIEIPPIPNDLPRKPSHVPPTASKPIELMLKKRAKTYQDSS